MNDWLNLNNLVTLPQKSIYAFVNEVDKQVYIGFSSNTLSSLFRILNEIKSSNHILKGDLGKLDFRILEEIDNSNKLRVRYNYWSGYYSNLGYSLYRNYRAVSYKVRIDVLQDFRTKKAGSYLLGVKLVTKGGLELLVGIFDDYKASELFIEKNYKNIDNIIYANNSITKEYYAR